MGFEGGKKGAVKLRSRPFSLQLHFSNLILRGYENLDAIIHVTVSVTTPTIFYGTMLGVTLFTERRMAATRPQSVSAAC